MHHIHMDTLRSEALNILKLFLHSLCCVYETEIYYNFYAGWLFFSPHIYALKNE